MAKAKLSAFSRFSKKQIIIALVFILGFGGFGVYKLAFSGAAPPKTATPVFVIVGDYANAKGHSPELYTVQDSVVYTGGPQTVVQLPVGVSADFSARKGGGTSYPKQTCYYMRAVGSPTKATIISGTNSQLITVSNDLNYYQKNCLQYSSSGTFKNFSVRNESGGLLNVYQQVLELTLN